MSIPTFLASNYNYYQNDSVTDVQEIIDDWRAQTALGTPVWLNPSGDTFNPPVDGYGRVFSITFTRVSAAVLTMELKNQSGVTIMTRAIQIPTTHGNIVRYYWGDGHFCIDVYDFTAGPEYFWGGLLDMSPEPQNAHANYVWGFGSRSVELAYHSGYFQWVYMMDDGVPTLLDRICLYRVIVTETPAPHRDLKGYRIFWPVRLWAEPAGGGVRRYCGRAYQTIFLEADAADVGADITVPIDAGVNGTFRVLNGTPSPYALLRAAIRVA